MQIPPEVLAAIAKNINARQPVVNDNALNQPIESDSGVTVPSGPTAPPIPGPVAAVVNAPSVSQPTPATPPDAILGRVAGATPDAEPPEAPEDKVARLAAPLPGQDVAPKLAPPAPPKKSLMQKVLPWLQGAGAIGAGLDAAMDRGPHGGQSGQFLESALAQRNARIGAAAKLQNVDIPKAQAEAEYLRGRNETAENVAGTRATTQQNVAQTNANTRLTLGRFKAIPGVGMFDTQTQQVIGGTQTGVVVTPEILKNYPSIPKEFLGKPVKLTDLAALDRADAMNIVPVQGAAGPALANKKTATAKSLGLGAPAAAVAANSPAIVRRPDGQGGTQLVAISKAEQLKTGEPSAQVEFAEEGPTAASRNMSQMARTITPHLNTLRDEIKELSPYLGPLMGRGVVNFAAGTVGSTGNPELDYKLGRLMSDFKLAASAVGRTHFAGRTGLPAAQYFGELFNAKRTPEELAGVLDSVPSYIEGYSEMQNFTPQRLGGQTGGGSKATSKQLDESGAMKILQEAGGDKEKARALAKQRGYKF